MDSFRAIVGQNKQREESFRSGNDSFAKLKSNNLGALQSFGLGGNSGLSSKRIGSNNFLDLQTVKKKRRQSYMMKGSSRENIASLSRPSIYGAGKSGAQSGLRRSFLGASNLMGMRKSSVNRKVNNRDEDDNSLGTDYSDDDNKDLEYRQRNKDLYKTLK